MTSYTSYSGQKRSRLKIISPPVQNNFQLLPNLQFQILGFQQFRLFSERHDPAFHVASARGGHGEGEGAVGVVLKGLGFGPGSGFDVAGFGGCEPDRGGDGVAVDQVEGGVQGVFGVEGVGVGDVFGAGADAGDALDGVGSDGFVAELYREKIEATVVFEEV